MPVSKRPGGTRKGGSKRRKGTATRVSERLRTLGEGAWGTWWREVGPGIEEALDAALPAGTEAPRNVHRAMRYSVFSGGKRIRPALTVLGYRMGGGRGRSGYALGAAIEMIHTFYLIHDDLPCMDDDDFRRGRLSCNRKFGEAIAVLAGDALQVAAFDLIANLPVAAERRVRALADITRAVGTFGVIGGQVVDIESEGKRISAATLQQMHERKTGALLRCSLTSGAILAGMDGKQLRRLADFGSVFGLLFQTVDDLLDELGSYRELGRRRGRDRLRGKATAPAILGMDRTRARLGDLVEGSLLAIPVEGARGEIFVDLVGRVVGRLPQDWLEHGR